MQNITVATVGDSTLDSFLVIEEQDASLLCDIRHQNCEIAFKYGEKIPVKNIRQNYGGSALNTAIGFSRLSLSTSIYTIFGDDDYGRGGVDFLNQNNVSTNNVIFQGETNQASIVVYKGERTIFSYHAPRDYAQFEIKKAQWIYFASATKGSDKLSEQILRLVEEGSKLIFNPGSWQLKNFGEFSKIVKNSEVIMLNKSEADFVIGEQESISKQLDKVFSLGPRIAVITDGPNGAYIKTEAEKMHMSTLAAKVVDPTGAGDAFAVGLIGGIIFGKSIEESMKWGMVNSASIIEHFGANANLQNFGAIATRAKAASGISATIIK